MCSKENKEEEPSLAVVGPFKYLVRAHLRRGWHRASIVSRYYVCPRREKQPVFVITQPRSGSTLLDDLMNSVPGVSAIGEVLSPSLPYGISPKGAGIKKRALRHIRYSLNSLPASVSTAKFLLGQMRVHDVQMDDFRNEFPDAKYVVLYRASLLEHYVSYEVAKLTGKWVGRKATPKFEGRMRLDLDDLESFCQRQKQNYEGVLSHPWLRDCAAIVNYEELAAEPQQIFDSKLLPLVNLPSTTVQTGMRKQINRQMADVIENYEDVMQRLGDRITARYDFPAV